jgi:hypothetical protein
LGRRPIAHLGGVQEPGLDRHEWETEWQQLEPLVLDSPHDALPELHDLVRRMLEDRGYAIDDEVVNEGNDPEIIAEYLSARETTRRAERADPDLTPGDIAAAIQSYRHLFEYLVESRAVP